MMLASQLAHASSKTRNLTGMGDCKAVVSAVVVVVGIVAGVVAVVAVVVAVVVVWLAL